MCNIAQIDLCTLQRVFANGNTEYDTLFPPPSYLLLALFIILFLSDCIQLHNKFTFLSLDLLLIPSLPDTDWYNNFSLWIQPIMMSTSCNLHHCNVGIIIIFFKHIVSNFLHFAHCEFIIAQSLHTMKGILIGFYYIHKLVWISRSIYFN